MSLKDLEIKKFYDSVRDNVYKDFFNKVLSHSTKCNRLGGIFTSRNFAACADGMQEFIKNDGKMKLILTPSFSNEDITAIQKGLKKETDVIIDNWITEFDEIKDKFIEDHVKALAWLLKHNLLEIKVVVVYDSNGQVLNSAGIEKIGLFNRKIGIYIGKGDDDIISFQGDIDFDDKIYGEWYRFDVFRYWEPNEKERVNENYDYFNKFWNGDEIKGLEGITIKTLDLPQALHDEIIKKSPESKSQITLQHPIKLFPKQLEAISEWKKNGYRGIFEMATGTGKTWAAIGAIKELEKEIGPLIVVIAVPSITLISQWKDELAKWDIQSTTDRDNKNWKSEFKDEIDYMKYKKNESVVIVLLYKSYTKKEFLELLQKTSLPLLLIADEAHNAGAPLAQLGLVDNYEYRLALSATIERYFDDEGTKIIVDYFGKNAITYTLEQAINDEKLVGYYYYPIFLDLEPDELGKYRTYSKMIAISWGKIQQMKKKHLNTFAEENKKFNLTLKRANVIKNARQKIPAFRQLIDKDPKLKHTFVFCSGEQIDQVQNILTNRLPEPIMSRRITQNKPKTYAERVEILKGLADEEYQIIIGIKILDEGIDVPEANNCILLESTGNPKQFIQRRGRVLRIFRGTYKDGTKKDFATIYDFLIIPELSENASEEEFQIHEQYVEGQLRRQIEMARIAKNSPQCLDEISKIKKKFNME